MDVKTKHAGLFALLAGIVTGLAFSAKETGLLTAAIIMGWLACSGNGRRMILPFITGVACLVLLECVFFRIVSGDFLYHYRAVSQYQLAKVSSHSIEKAYQSLHIYPREMVRDGQFAMGFLIVLTGLPLLARRGVRIMPVVWLLVGFLTLQFASS
jgi:hypothetical protein